MPQPASYTRVALVGAAGVTGRAVLTALLAAGLSVTIIIRKESKSAFVGAAIVKRVDFDNQDELVDALGGHEAVVSTSGVKGGKDPQFALIDASIKAGVQRFIPSEFGSDTFSESTSKIAKDLFAGKVAVHDYLKSKESSGLTWTAIITGPFTDFCLRVGFFGIDFSNAKATLYDAGNSTQLSTTTLTGVGKAVVGVLQNPEATVNRPVYVASTTTTQKAMVEAAEKVTGKTFSITQATSHELEADGDAALAKHDFEGAVKLIQAAFWRKDGGSDHCLKHEDDSQLLGVSAQSIEEIVRGIM